MPRFRKKPVVIDAECWTVGGDPPAGITSWGSAGYIADTPNPYPEFRETVRSMLGRDEILNETIVGWVPGLEGGYVAFLGDWIIRGIKGERYPCKPDIFEATYEPAD